MYELISFPQSCIPKSYPQFQKKKQEIVCPKKCSRKRVFAKVMALVLRSGSVHACNHLQPQLLLQHILPHVHVHLICPVDIVPAFYHLHSTPPPTCAAPPPSQHFINIRSRKGPLTLTIKGGQGRLLKVHTKHFRGLPSEIKFSQKLRRTFVLKKQQNGAEKFEVKV